MEEFEYCTMVYTLQGFWGNKVEADFEERLNYYGSQGWELVNSVSTSYTIVSIFKRKIRQQ